MKNIKHTSSRTARWALLLAMSMGLGSCSLEEENPGGFTMEKLAETESGFEALINNVYFGLHRSHYGTAEWVFLQEGTTDLWTSNRNMTTNDPQWFWFYAGGAPNTTYTNNYWNTAYDGIGACNLALSLAHLAPTPQPKLNQQVAQARFMRAVYYFNLVHLFGGVTLVTEPQSGTLSYKPERADPMTIYKEIIIPDLEFAIEWLEKGTDDMCTIPTKKSAIGFMARALLQSVEFDESKQYADDALKYAKMLIDDCEAGGATYGAYLYPTFDEVFAEVNNKANKEALYKHRWYAGSAGSGTSNQVYQAYRNREYFYCRYTQFSTAIRSNQPNAVEWGGNPEGRFMPTRHLLNLFVQDDNTLDPRFHSSFDTELKANSRYGWDASTMAQFDHVGNLNDTLNVGDLAIKFIMPQDADYATEQAQKHTAPYLIVDYADVYSDDNKNVKMMYTYVNPSGDYTGEKENLFRSFYPSLSKFNSSSYFVVRQWDRLANLNAHLIMRMAEMYLVAAEADLYVNGGSNALGYINKIRTRAGANPLSGTVTVRTILDERARELCGEEIRYYDLKRTGMLKNADYLTETHPDLAKYFKPEYALRPIPSNYTDVLTDGGSYYQNPGY